MALVTNVTVEERLFGEDQADQKPWWMSHSFWVPPCRLDLPSLELHLLTC